jgi:hypothetical protein
MERCFVVRDLLKKFILRRATSKQVPEAPTLLPSSWRCRARERCLARGGRACEEQRLAGHIPLANHVGHQPARLPRRRLPHEPRSHRYRGPIGLQETQTE